MYVLSVINMYLKICFLKLKKKERQKKHYFIYFPKGLGKIFVFSAGYILIFVRDKYNEMIYIIKLWAHEK